MGEISNMILRMRELAVQMENGIYTSKDRDNAQLEVNALLQEIDKIASNTRFNDVNFLTVPMTKPSVLATPMLKLSECNRCTHNCRYSKISDYAVEKAASGDSRRSLQVNRLKLKSREGTL